MDNINEKDMIPATTPEAVTDPMEAMEAPTAEDMGEALEPAEPETPAEAETVEETEASEAAEALEKVEASEEVDVIGEVEAEADVPAEDPAATIEALRQELAKANEALAEAQREREAPKKKAILPHIELPKREAKPKADPISKEELQRELEARKEQLVHSTMELGNRLKSLISDEIEAANKKDKKRWMEMLGVFAKHNFYANGFTPVEMRTTLEDLGPTYVKIGQIMSSRVDLLPQSYCEELGRLRSNVRPLDAEVARAVIEQEVGKPIDEIYSEFRDKPLGSASIGQAHYAVLKDGTRVVTKVQRPLIAEMMRKDFVLLKRLAGIVNMSNEGKDDEEEMVDLLSVIEELEKVTEEELDFRVEAENTRFFHDNCIEDEDVCTCPQVIDELTTERIFTMTFVDGYSISKRDRILSDGYDPLQIGQVILENYVHQVLDVGTFHGDPHQGNIMIEHGKPCWIDFGMIGRISDADVNIIQQLILGLLGRDLDALVNAIMSMGATSPRTDRNKLIADADVMFDKYMNVQSIDDVDLGNLLNEVMDLASKHHISLPGRYTMLVRSIATIEGVIEELCPDLNLFEIISGKLMERARKNLDLQQEVMNLGKGVLEVGKKTANVPMMAYDALNNLVRGRTKVNFELTGYEELIKAGNNLALNLVLALFSCILFFGSCLLCTANIEPRTPSGMPILAIFGLVFSIALGIFTVKRISKKK